MPQLYLAGDGPGPVLLDDHPVPAHLLLDEDDLLLAPDHEVTAGVVRTLVQLTIDQNKKSSTSSKNLDTSYYREYINIQLRETALAIPFLLPQLKNYIFYTFIRYLVPTLHSI